jgi:hypothetical protein
MCATVLVTLGSKAATTRRLLPCCVMRTVRAPGRQRRLGRSSGEVHAIRRQLRNAVRDDRGREVHRLSSRSDEGKFGDLGGCHVGRMTKNAIATYWQAAATIVSAWKTSW